MNYTQVYNKIYSELSQPEIPHEITHNTALRITNALADIYLYVGKNNPKLLPTIKDIVKDIDLKNWNLGN